MEKIILHDLIIDIFGVGSIYGLGIGFVAILLGIVIRGLVNIYRQSI